MATLVKRGKYYHISFMMNNRRVRKSLKTTSKRLAEIEKARIESEIEKGNLGLAPITIETVNALDLFIEMLLKTKSPPWGKRCKQMLQPLRKYLINKPELVTINKIIRIHLEEMLSERELEICNKTYNEELAIIKRFFKWLMKRNYILKDPSLDIERKTTTPTPPRAFTNEEIGLILNNATKQKKQIYEFFLHTGLRLGEFTYLEWDDIDFKNRQIYIRLKKDWLPKTRTSRIIPMTKRAEELIKMQPKRSNYVFTTRTGKQHVFLLFRFKYLLQKIKERHGIDISNANIHTFRHTFATHCLMNGIDIYTVSRYLGHSSVKMTEKYMTLLPDYAKRELDKLSYSTDSKSGSS